MDETAVWAEYKRLGYDRGWVFAMTPLAWLSTATTVMVGLNPGGAEGEHDSTDGWWETPYGNAYLLDRWVPGSDALYPIQVQVAALHELLGLGPKDVFAGQFIPFRSRSLVELPNYSGAMAFARDLWSWALAQSPANLFICMGNTAAVEIAKLIGAKLEEPPFPSGWGKIQVRRYVSPEGKVVAELPHPSHYPLLSMQDPQKLNKAKCAIKAAARQAGEALPPGCVDVLNQFPQDLTPSL